MSFKRLSVLCCLLGALMLGIAPAGAQHPDDSGAGLAPSGETITYQGQLKQGGAAATGTYDFQFGLYAALTGGSALQTVSQADVAVSDGIFTVQLTFSEGLLAGDERWLELAVKADAESTYTTLSPRQPISAAPLALALPGFWTNQNATSPNLLGGYSGNSVASGVVGGAISGGGTSGSLNAAYDNYATIAGGAGNSAGSNDGTVSNDVYPAIGGGLGNTASQEYSVIGGGQGNAVSGAWAAVGGGRANAASADYAVIAGGTNNSAAAQFATVAGGGSATSGQGNRVYDNYGAIGGGTNNSAGLTADTTSQQYATVAGGSGNTASNTSATVGGGSTNTASGTYSIVGGGTNNTAGGNTATIGGGQLNAANGDYATISGGRGNTASSTIAAVGGGQSNQATNTGAFVGGGQTNTATGQYAAVAGGVNNDATNTYAAVVGGINNQAAGAGAFVGGGQNNNANSTLSAILGGNGNTTFGEYAVAAGQNAVAKHDGSFVWAGKQSAKDDSISSTGPGQFIVRAPGGMWLGAGTSVVMPPDALLATEAGAYLSKGGTWANASDRALKTNIAAVDGRAVLRLVAAMPISSWNYHSEGDGVRHLGPMAQDFRAAFGLGADERHI
ncbi:MAG TPA: tail fiber domain-containing protein, partial [Herpetosiphonaceae bacterium]